VIDKNEAAAIYADALELSEAILATLPEHEPQRALLSELVIRAHNLAGAAGALATMLNQLQRHTPELLAALEAKDESLALTYHATTREPEP
jgi:hypothetical protein